MKRTMIIAATLGTLGASVAGLAHATEAKDTPDTSMKPEIQLLQSSKISLPKAGEIAVDAVKGQLAAVEFNDENGKGVFEATVFGKDGTATKVLVDANSGAVLSKAPMTKMADEDSQENENESD